MGTKFTFFSAIKFLNKYLKGFKKNYIMFFTGWLIDMVINIMIPVMLGVMIDEIIYFQNITTFFNISIIILFTLIFLCILYFFIYAQHQYLMTAFTMQIKQDIFLHCHIGKAENLTEYSSGEIINMLQINATECLHFLIRNVVHFIIGLIKIIVIVALLFNISWNVGIFIMIAAPFSVYVSVLFGKTNKKYGEAQSKKLNFYNGWLFEILKSINIIRVNNSNQIIKDEFVKYNKELLEINKKSEINKIKSDNIISFINLIIRLTIYGFAGYLAMSLNMTIGSLLILISYYSILTDQVWWTSNSYVDSQKRIAYIKNIKDFLSIPVENDAALNDNFDIDNGDIEFENVSFCYQKSHKIFNRLNLKIKGGTSTAIVGKSGSGKTTLAYMLLKFYDPSEGKILIDGNDINKYTVNSIRSKVGLIAQDVLIFNMSIRDNISLGNPLANEEEIIDACKKAEIWSFIQMLPLSLDTVIGNGGQEISGGQKQRIALARLFVRHPQIMIFDEATSSIDNETEESIYSALKPMLVNKTSIIITHKLSSVLQCDNVIVLKEGVIHACGKTEDILRDSDFLELFCLDEEV